MGKIIVNAKLTYQTESLPCWELDKVLEQDMLKHGYEFLGRGFRLRECTRELFFEKKFDNEKEA